MIRKVKIYYDDLDIKIEIGNLVINIFYIRYTPSKPVWGSANHCHSSYELHYIPEGRGTLIKDRKKYDIEKGILYVTGPGVYHEQICDSEDPMNEFCINFDYKIKKSADIDGVPAKEVKGLVSALEKCDFWFGKDECEDIRLFENIFDELEQKSTGYYSIVKSCLTQIIVNMLRHFTQKDTGYIIPGKTLDDARRQILDEILYNRYAEIDVHSASQAIGLSSRQFERVMKQLYSMSFKEKLLRIRLDNAIYLLKSTDMTIDKICSQIGFNSTSYFCRYIKHMTGKTATQIRGNEQ